MSARLPSRGRTAARRTLRPPRPRLEWLEDRTAPATLLVGSAADSNDRSDGLLSLREAVMLHAGSLAYGALSPQEQAYVTQPETLGGNDTIQFASALNGQAIVLGSALPDLSGELSIQGPAQGSLTVRRDGGTTTPQFSVFKVAAGATVGLSGLTISGGASDGGGGIYAGQGSTLMVSNSTLSGNSASSEGGGIFADQGSSVAVRNSTLAGNSASSSSFSSSFGGGGIYANYGSVTVSNSTLAGNSAGLGGGIYANYGSLTVSNSTLAGNSAFSGGGIYANYGSVTVSNSTLAGNSASYNGGGIAANYGIYAYAGTTTLRNTLVARNTLSDGVTPSDISGVVDTTNSWNNLIGTGGSGGLADGVQGNQVGVSDPGLAPLGDYGGPTQTMALLPGSPAIDAGRNAFVAPGDTDQRGLPRIAGGTMDIGAFESQGFTITPTSGNHQSATINVAFAQPLTVTVKPNNAGEPVVGGQVTFTAPASGASASLPGAPAKIGADGQASVTASANGTAGSYRVTASAGGALAAHFDLTNLAAPTATGTVATFDPGTGTWYLRNEASAGPADAGAFAYGAPGWVAVMGDWDGDGTATVGVFDPSTATWYLRNSNSAGAPDYVPFQYGLPGWLPVVGDWSHSGHTGIGVFDPSTGTFYLRAEVSAGQADAGVFAYGLPGWLPVAGDWSGSGHAGVGVFDPGTATWYLRNEVGPGPADAGVFAYGAAGWKPVVGDWDGDGVATVGVCDPAGRWYLRDANGAGAPDHGPFPYGLGPWQPLAFTHPPLAQPSPASARPASAPAAGNENLLSAVLLGTGRRPGSADDSVLTADGAGRLQALDALFTAGV
jgi:hypothetical protein